MKKTELSDSEYCNIVNFLIRKGYSLSGRESKKELFFKKEGKEYDFSAADLTQLDRIEREGLFLV